MRSNHEKDPESHLGDDLVKRRQEHHAKKLESHQKLKKWLNRERYRSQMEELKATLRWADITSAIIFGILAVLFALARGVRYTNLHGDTFGLITGYALVTVIFLFLFGVPAVAMLIFLFYYRK